MKFRKSTGSSLSDATKPLRIVARVVGMNPRSEWHKIYTILILVCWFSLIITVWIYYTAKYSHTYAFNLFVHVLHDTCHIISISFILVLSLFRHNRFMLPPAKLLYVDERLKSFGGLIDNGETFRLQIFQIIYIGLIPFITWLVDFCINPPRPIDKFHNIYWMLWAYISLVLIICGVADCSLLSTIYSDIDYLVNFRLPISARTDDDVLRKLKILRRLYHDLWKIANRVNSAYGPHLLMAATTTLVLITSKLWETYYLVNIGNRSMLKGTISGMYWTFFYVSRILFIAQSCDSTVTEAQTTSVVLLELDMKRDHRTDVKREIRDFSAQVQLEARNFTACRFFDVNFNTIGWIASAACTYLVVLIQMGIPNAPTVVPDNHRSNIQTSTLETNDVKNL